MIIEIAYLLIEIAVVIFLAVFSMAAIVGLKIVPGKYTLITNVVVLIFWAIFVTEVVRMR